MMVKGCRRFLRSAFAIALVFATFSTGAATLDGQAVLGPARPNESAVLEHAIQLYVAASGPYRVEALAPEGFPASDGSPQLLQSGLLEWRINGGGQGWAPFSPGAPTLIHSGTGDGQPVILNIDYRLTPTWHVPAVSGGYLIQVPYTVVGDAVLYASTIWPSPAIYGRPVTVACVRSAAEDERLRFELNDAQGKLLHSAEQSAAGRDPKVLFTWSVDVPEGTYPFRIEGEQTGTCTAGVLHVMGPPGTGLQMERVATEPVRPEALHVKAELDGPGVVGDWIRLFVEVRNNTRGTLLDAAVDISLPQGLLLAPGAPQTGSRMPIGTLEPDETWRRVLYLWVGPDARADDIVLDVQAESAGKSGSNTVHGRTRVSFTVRGDSWLQPEALLYGSVHGAGGLLTVDTGTPEKERTDAYSVSVPPGWRVVWPRDAEGRRLSPRLVSVRGAAPVRYEVTIEPPAVPRASEIYGSLALQVDAGGFRTHLVGGLDAQARGMSLSAQLKADGVEKYEFPWQLRLPTITDPWSRLGVSLIGDGTNLQAARLDWTSNPSPMDGGIRLSVARTEQGDSEVKLVWYKRNPAGGLSAQHSIGRARRDLRISVWRAATLDSPGIRIEHKTGRRGVIHLGLAHHINTPFGRTDIAGRWTLEPDTTPARGMIGLSWHGGTMPGASPFLAVRLDNGRLDWSNGLQLLSQGVRQRVVIHRDPAGDRTAIEWLLTDEASHRTGRLRFEKAADTLRGTASAVNLTVGSFRVNAHVEAERRTVGNTGIAETLLKGDRHGLRWSFAWDDDGERRRVDQRIDGRVRLAGMSGSELGVMMGMRNVTRFDGSVSPRSTFFAGVFGEVALAPRIRAGVGLVKWNQGAGNERNYYIRYEATEAFWIEAGYHRAPGSISLLSEGGDGGPYLRIQWAVLALR